MDLSDWFYRDLKCGDATKLSLDITKFLCEFYVGSPTLRVPKVGPFWSFMSMLASMHLGGAYAIHPEEERRGFYFISLLPKYSNYYAAPGAVIGIDVSDTEKKMETDAKYALKKVNDYGCSRLLEDLGTSRIDKYGLTYWNYHVLVLK